MFRMFGFFPSFFLCDIFLFYIVIIMIKTSMLQFDYFDVVLTLCLFKDLSDPFWFLIFIMFASVNVEGEW